MRVSLAGAVLLLSSCRLAAQGVAVEGTDALLPAADKAIHGAVELARSRMLRPGCRLLLQSYTDAEGRPLAENLSLLDAPAAAYLGWLVFRPAGASARRCQDPAVVFFTTPGSRVVYACSDRIANVERGLAGALVVHEALHTLGLGENPPSPAQITARVRERCGL